MLTFLRNLIWPRPVSGAQAPAAQASAAPVVMEEAPPAPLAGLLRAAGFGDAEGWAAHLARPMDEFGITTQVRRAAFIATIAHETGGGSRLEESLNYTVDALLKTFSRQRISEADARAYGRIDVMGRTARPASPAALANLLYGGEYGRKNLGNTEHGDGWRFRGRGLIQVTGRANYDRVGRALDLPLLTQPALLVEREHAARSAALWWGSHGCNALADTGDVTAWRRRVNGGLRGLEDVLLRYQAVLACR